MVSLERCTECRFGESGPPSAKRSRASLPPAIITQTSLRPLHLPRVLFEADRTLPITVNSVFPRTMSKKPTIAVVGSLNFDLVTRVPRLPDLGETLTAKSFGTNCGGKGANQAVAAARLADRCEKVDVKMVGAVGSDGFGNEMKQQMRKEGVDVEDVRVVDGMSSGVAVIVVSGTSGLFFDDIKLTLKSSRSRIPLATIE